MLLCFLFCVLYRISWRGGGHLINGDNPFFVCLQEMKNWTSILHAPCLAHMIPNGMAVVLREYAAFIQLCVAFILLLVGVEFVYGPVILHVKLGGVL